MTDFLKDDTYIENMNKNAHSYLKKAENALKNRNLSQCIYFLAFAEKYYNVCPYYNANKQLFKDTFLRASALIDPGILIENLNTLISLKTGQELQEILGPTALMNIVYETTKHLKGD